MPADASEDTFHGFVVARTPALSRTAYLLTGDAHLAEDLVQKPCSRRNLMSSALGLVGTDLLVAVGLIEDGDQGDRRVELVGAPPPERVIELDDLVPLDLTIATDLMAPDQPTVHRAEPDWPGSDVRWIRLGVGAGVVLLGVTVVVRRQRRPR